MSSTRHRQDWQELRNSGMSVGQMAKMFGVTDATICNHTYAPMPEDIVKMKRGRIVQMYLDNKTWKQIAQSTHMTIHQIREVVEDCVLTGEIDPLAYSAREEPKEREDVRIPVSPEDDCPNRNTRGLSEAAYKRLLKVNREYDKKVAERNTDRVGGAGYIRDAKDDT